MIDYVMGDATSPVGDGPKIVVHVCNDVGGWGKGFVLAISRRWQAPERAYREWHETDGDLPLRLGQIQFVEVEPCLWIANLIGQHGVEPINGVPPVRYEAIETGLQVVARFARERGASVHMPRIGCGLAGGDWDAIETIVERSFGSAGVNVTVYDLPPD